MYNIQWSNEVRFPCYLFSIPPNHGCLGKVCGHTEMDGLQGNCNKTPSYQDRYIRLVVGDFHARLLVHIIAGNQRGHWGETHLDYDYKCLCSDERCYRRIFLRHDLPRNTPTSSDNVMLHLTRRFATTIFSATQRCNIIATLFRMVSTLFQHCNAVLRQKSSLRIVPCKITYVRNATALAQARPESNFAKLN